MAPSEQYWECFFVFHIKYTTDDAFQFIPVHLLALIALESDSS